MKSIFKKSIIAAVLLFGAASASNAQVKVGVNSTNIGANSNLEVEAANGNKTIVDKATGKVTIQDGTQGINRIFSSDANGMASWKLADEVNIARMIVRANNRNVLQPTGGSYVPPIPFVDGDASTYNSATGEFTAPSDGFYQYNYGLEVIGPGGTIFTIQISNLDIEDGNLRGNPVPYNPRTVSGTRYLLAGEKFTPLLYLGGGLSFTSAWKLRNLSVVVFKL